MDRTAKRSWLGPRLSIGRGSSRLAVAYSHGHDGYCYKSYFASTIDS